MFNGAGIHINTQKRIQQYFLKQFGHYFLCQERDYVVKASGMELNKLSNELFDPSFMGMNWFK